MIDIWKCYISADCLILLSRRPSISLHFYCTATLWWPISFLRSCDWLFDTNHLLFVWMFLRWHDDSTQIDILKINRLVLFVLLILLGFFFILIVYLVHFYLKNWRKYLLHDFKETLKVRNLLRILLKFNFFR